MVSLLLGLKCNVFMIKSKQAGSISEKYSLEVTFFVFERISKIYLPKFVPNDSMSSTEGVPVHISTFSIWFSVEVPGKRGLPFIISAAKQPKLQTSIDLVYFWEPRRISGARYQRVAMYYVRMSMLTSWSSSMERTSPKSHILASQA